MQTTHTRAQVASIHLKPAIRYKRTLSRQRLRNTYAFIFFQGTVVAYHIIDRDAHRKSHAAVHCDTVHLFRVQFRDTGVNDRMAKFAQVYHLGAYYTLRDDAHQGQVGNLSGFLILGNHVAAKQSNVV
jgi:hypothetical protein